MKKKHHKINPKVVKTTVLGHQLDNKTHSDRIAHSKVSTPFYILKIDKQRMQVLPKTSRDKKDKLLYNNL